MGNAPQLRNSFLAAVTCMLAVASSASAVEMFTYFGDGSYIGLPSLEVPIEAYPGIPLRSDRLRAQRSGRAAPRGTVGRFRGRGITIRVPAAQPTPLDLEPPMPEPVPADAPPPSVVAPDSSDAAELSDALHADPFAAKRVAGLPPGSELDFGGLRELSAYEQTEVPQP